MSNGHFLEPQIIQVSFASSPIVKQGNYRGKCIKYDLGMRQRIPNWDKPFNTFHMLIRYSNHWMLKRTGCVGLLSPTSFLGSPLSHSLGHEEEIAWEWGCLITCAKLSSFWATIFQAFQARFQAKTLYVKKLFIDIKIILHGRLFFGVWIGHLPVISIHVNVNNVFWFGAKWKILFEKAIISP